MNQDNKTVHDDIVAFFVHDGNGATLYTHRPSKTSEESMQARFEASGEKVTGAKALLVKLDIKDRTGVYAVIIMPGFNRLDSKALKAQLKAQVPGLHGFRFASPEEMAHIARGIQPGKMPPVGRPVFPDIRYTFIDAALQTHEKVGFNAADFERSIIMPSAALIDLVPHDGVVDCSLLPA